ncbi:MAG: hypothetical protein GY928_30480 [Colwellia sp.]|nr:hypothetical protein [Colwellia sp.]
MYHDKRIIFKKTGKQIKEAISNRCNQLGIRLEARNQALDQFMKDKKKLRSYLVRSSSSSDSYSRGSSKEDVLYAKDDISSEEKDEIKQLCQRIFEIEQEIRRLTLIAAHIDEVEEFELELQELIGYGFEA